MLDIKAEVASAKIPKLYITMVGRCRLTLLSNPC